MICGNKIGGIHDDKTYIVQFGETELIGVVVDELEMFDACCSDVKAGKKFVCDSGVSIGINDSPCCAVIKGVHEVYPGVEFLLKLEDHDLWNYTDLQCMIAPKSSPYAIDKIVVNNEVRDTSGNKLADITKDIGNKAIRLNITNNTTDIYLLYFFVCKGE